LPGPETMRTVRRAAGPLRRARSTLFDENGLRRAVQRSRGLALPQVPPVGYLGFAARGNAGDDAILLAHRRVLAPVRLGLLPLHAEPQVLSLLGRLRDRPLFGGVLVGGGTVLGRGAWRRPLAHALAAHPGPLMVTGAGVEDPAFGGTRSHTDRDELERWAELLSGAAHLTVRGPRSAELLREVGVDAGVVSDPALLLGPARVPSERVRPKLLGLNVADPEDQYAGTETQAADACTRAVRTLLASGWTVRLLPFDRRDLAVALALRRAVGGRVEIVRRFANVDGLLDAIAECDVVVGQRLHSVVLAAAVAVPALAIDYRPKCRDFQLSIGREPWTVSTVDITAERILDAVSALHEQRERHCAEIADEVRRARATLLDGERHVQRLVAGA
jgi:polysaccharide pyruvyl transferase